MNDPAAIDVREIRKQIRRQRQQLTDPERQSRSRQACDRMIDHDSFMSAGKIGGFLAFDGEANPLDLMIEAVNRGQQVFVPIIVGKGKPLRFAPWTMTAKMKTNRFGIAEPDVPESDWIEPIDLDFVITPLVAFDESCHRIGVGGGFYDRSFSFRKNGAGKSVTMIGFAFELQKMARIEPRPWDVPIDGVATESAFYQRG